MTIKRFNYTDSKGKESSRVCWMVSPPSSNYFMIDLTEYDEDERLEYIQLLAEIHGQYQRAIKEIGLGTNYRNFKPSRMKTPEPNKAET